jgi:hypothetical protein
VSSGPLGKRMVWRSGLGVTLHRTKSLRCMVRISGVCVEVFYCRYQKVVFLTKYPSYSKHNAIISKQ